MNIIAERIVSDTFNGLHRAIHAPQAITTKQLLTGVDNVPALLHPQWPIIGVFFYLTLKNVAKRLCKQFGTTGKSATFKRLALLHNVAICLFSLSASVGVWTIVRRVYVDEGFASVVCDSTTWNMGLNKWGMLFYLSKYWELVDTFLLVWKRRSPSFLQVYHHAVTIVCAYLLQASHTPATFLFVGLNATVHTVMYAYYALALLGIRSKLKPLITIMQIMQFIVGICIAASSFFLRGGSCACESQKVALAAMISHAAFLTVLFIKFYKQTYTTKTDAKPKRV